MRKEIKIIVLGNDYGVSDICKKYEVIHCKNIKTLEKNQKLKRNYKRVNSLQKEKK